MSQREIRGVEVIIGLVYWIYKVMKRMKIVTLD